MKTAIWEESPGALQGLVLPSYGTNQYPGPMSRNFAYFDCYTFYLTTGLTLLYTTCDQDIAYPGSGTFTSNEVRFDTDKSRAAGHWKTGLDVDTWQIVVFPRPSTDPYGQDVIGGIGWMQALRAGMLDGAIVDVDRAYFALPMPEYSGRAQQPVGLLRIFAGRVAECDFGRSSAVITINSHLELLDVQMPRNLFQAPCRFKLFDAGCSLNKANFAVNTYIYSTNDALTLFLPPGLTFPATGDPSLGQMQMTSGKNAGFTRAVRYWSGPEGAGPTAIQLLAPLPFVPVTGDTLTAYPGCNKTTQACAAFNNILNFGGTPFIPAPEASI